MKTKLILSTLAIAMVGNFAHADITLRRGGQVRVDALVGLMPRPVMRFLTSASLLMMFGFLGLLIWYGYPLAMSNWQRPMGVAGLS